MLEDEIGNWWCHEKTPTGSVCEVCGVEERDLGYAWELLEAIGFGMEEGEALDEAITAVALAMANERAIGFAEAASVLRSLGSEAVAVAISMAPKAN